MTTAQNATIETHEGCPFIGVSRERVDSMIKNSGTGSNILKWITGTLGIIIVAGGLLFSAGLTSSKIDNTRLDLDQFVTLTGTKFVSIDDNIRTLDVKIDDLTVSVVEIRGMAADLKDIKTLMYKSLAAEMTHD